MGRREAVFPFVLGVTREAAMAEFKATWEAV
jgi:hypothetical protein